MKFVEQYVEPGQHLGDFDISVVDEAETIRMQGLITLEPDRAPTVEINGDLPGVHRWPQRREFREVRGHLQNNMDVVLAGGAVESFLPGVTILRSGVALVGLGLRRRDDQKYVRCRVQLTGLEALFGWAPLSQLASPRPGPWAGQTFAVTAAQDVTRSWADDNMEVRCSYDLRIQDPPYGVHLGFFPIVTFGSSVGLDIYEWLDLWISPLVDVVRAATGSNEQLTWIGLKSDAAESVEGAAHVYGTGISQKPYVATMQAAMQPAIQGTLSFDLDSSNLSLLELIRGWRDHAASNNPFPELYRTVISQPELPERARFLYLVQALEGLHTYENREGDDVKAAAHVQRRTEVIQAASSALTEPDLAYLKDNWSKRPIDNLERRLLELIASLPPIAERVMDALRQTTVGTRLPADNTAAALVQAVRNDLAHGNRNYDSVELEPWTAALERLARAHMLRLLGCPVNVIERGLGA